MHPSLVGADELELLLLVPFVEFELEIRCGQSFVVEGALLNLRGAIHELGFQNFPVQ